MQVGCRTRRAGTLIRLLTQYGVAAVDVTRGGTTATFGVYSTELGSPVVDTAGGTFRFTCDAAQAPCFVAVKAAALSDSDRHGALLSRAS